MFPNFIPDETSLQCDPSMRELSFKPGSHTPAFSSPIGQQIFKLVTSRLGVSMIIGAVVSAPSRPPVVALEPLLLWKLGPDAFTDDMKKLTGRIIRFVIEELGGRWVRRGIKVSIKSLYRSGSIYTFRPAENQNGQ